MATFRECFAKKLSANDVGETKSHQAGIVIPKSIIKLGYFPKLESGLNPRETINFLDFSDGSFIETQFIYYNSRTLGLGTRNEFRLTGIRKALKKHQMLVNSVVRFGYDGNTQQFAIEMMPNIDLEDLDNPGDDVLKISGGWKVVGRLQ